MKLNFSSRKPVCALLLAATTALNMQSAYAKIDRQAVVKRHDVKVSRTDSLASLTVGNGEFAFTVDATGLQSFPEYYSTGVPLGTQSEWGWHSFPNTGNYKLEESLRNYDLNGRKVSYAVQVKEPGRAHEAGEFFRQNVHRLQLGNIGFEFVKKDGSIAKATDLQAIDQRLDLWKGAIISKFSIEGTPFEVTTYAHRQKDGIAFRTSIDKAFVRRLRVVVHFPFPSNKFEDRGVLWQDAGHQSAIVSKDANGAVLSHQLDTTVYYVHAKYGAAATIEERGKHEFVITPSGTDFSCTMVFDKNKANTPIPSFAETQKSSETGWAAFWQSGGAVDFAGSTDKRAAELERRVVLSQYLIRAQSAGHFPEQETGLTYNSWYGKPHLEMYWWHAAHYALWGRTDLLEKSLDWYFTVADGAKKLAERQGYKGFRWQKMTDNEGRESPSSVGAFLVWQQPHFIYMAELVYRNTKDKKTLNKYKDLVFGTADFMASFPVYDKATSRYNLGKGLIPAQECFNATTTYNPTYELAYWSWALKVAQDWRKRLGLPANKEWQTIIDKLAPLPVKNGVYLATESTHDCYDVDSKYTIDHPAVLAGLSTIPPANGMDKATMGRTYDLVEKVWHWDHTWGWDFPLIAMTATRLGEPEKALNGLFKDVKTNTYLPNGHNFQDDRLTIYLPGNGGILSAVALMCVGSDGNKTSLPGFPKDGSWKVQWEGLKPMP